MTVAPGLICGKTSSTVIGGHSAPIPLHDIRGHAPEGIELELHAGGQPNYWWLLAAE